MVGPFFLALTSTPSIAPSSFEDTRAVGAPCAVAPLGPPAIPARASQPCLRCTANLPTIVYWWRRLSRNFARGESALRSRSSVCWRQTDDGAGARYRAPLANKPELHHAIRFFRVRRHSGKPARNLRRVAQQRRARKDHRRKARANVRAGRRRVHGVERLYQRTQSETRAARRIVQSWRTTKFSAADPDSQIEVLLEPA